MKELVFLSLSEEDIKFYRENLKGKDINLRLFKENLEEVLEDILDAEFLCVFVVDKLTERVLEKFKNLSYIHTRSVGFDHIDLQYCKRKGIKVSHIPSYSPSAIAQHTLSMMLYLIRKLGYIEENVKKIDFSHSKSLLAKNLEDLTVGVIGTGRIGSAFARYCLKLNMKVLAYDLKVNEELKREGVTYTSLEELLKESDVISLHVPYNPSTHHLIDEKSIKLMKDGVILLNTSRGKVVDTDALYKSFKEGKFSGLGLDVFEDEEILILKGYAKGRSSDKVLKILEMSEYPNVLITPHIAYFTESAVKKIREVTLKVVKGFMKGKLSEIKDLILC